MAASVPTTAPIKPVLNLKARLDAVEAHLAPLLAAPLNETVGKMSTAERCQLQILLSYTINTTFFIYLKTQGVDPNEHPVMKELERVREYIVKAKKASAPSKIPTTSVNKAAAARFIKHALASNPKESDIDTEEASDRVIELSDDEDDEDKSPADQGKEEKAVDQGANSVPLKRKMDPFTGYDQDEKKKKKDKRDKNSKDKN